MNAKVIQEFSGRPDGEPLARRMLVGEMIEGDLAAVAIEQGWAQPADTSGEVAPAPITAEKPAGKTKRKRG